MKVLEAAAGWARPGQACLLQKAGDHGRALITRESLGGGEFAPRWAAVGIQRYPVQEDPHELKSELGTHAALPGDWANAARRAIGGKDEARSLPDPQLRRQLG